MSAVRQAKQFWNAKYLRSKKKVRDMRKLTSRVPVPACLTFALQAEVALKAFADAKKKKDIHAMVIALNIINEAEAAFMEVRKKVLGNFVKQGSANGSR